VPHADVEIGAGSDADLEALVAVLGQRRFFASCLAEREAGRGVLLVAWLEGTPVGDVFLDWGPAREPEIRRYLPGVPMLVHLEVLGPLQRRGIGTALLRAGEDTARRRGHERIALGVGVDNHGARRLYERLAYTDWGRGSVVTSWEEHDRDGRPVAVSETIDLLVKRLRG
jgi:GNAT superfamily N-acetyltransferase